MASYTMQLRDCMPKPATSGVDDKIYEMQVRICKAFANSSRLRMLDLLAKGERTVSDLQGELGITTANVSQHLAVLKTAGLLTERRDGTRRLYRADRNEMKKLRKFLGEYWTSGLERLRDVAEAAQQDKEKR